MLGGHSCDPGEHSCAQLPRRQPANPASGAGHWLPQRPQFSTRVRSVSQPRAFGEHRPQFGAHGYSQDPPSQPRSTCGRSLSQLVPHCPQKSGFCRVSMQADPPFVRQQVPAVPEQESLAPQRQTPSTQRSESGVQGAQSEPQWVSCEDALLITQPPSVPAWQLCEPTKQALWSATAHARDSPSTQFRTDSENSLSATRDAESLTWTEKATPGCTRAFGLPVSLPVAASNLNQLRTAGGLSNAQR